VEPKRSKSFGERKERIEVALQEASNQIGGREKNKMTNREVERENEWKACVQQQEQTTQLLLQTLQNMDNTISSLRSAQSNGGEGSNSNNSEHNNRTPLGSPPRITQHTFLPRDEQP